MKKAYVGNLAYGVTSDDLEEFFKEHGCACTKAIVISDRDTGQSKGFGFVDFDDDDAFDNALKLTGTDLQGRAVNINEAKPREDKPRGGRRNSF